MSQSEVMPPNGDDYFIVEILRRANLDACNTPLPQRTSETYTLLGICKPAADEIERLRHVAKRVDAIRSWLDDCADEIGTLATAKLYELLEVPCEATGCTLTMGHIPGHNNSISD